MTKLKSRTTQLDQPAAGILLFSNTARQSHFHHSRRPGTPDPQWQGPHRRRRCHLRPGAERRIEIAQHPIAHPSGGGQLARRNQEKKRS